MTIDEAKLIVNNADYYHYLPPMKDDTQPLIQLDGYYSVEELEAFVLLMNTGVNLNEVLRAQS